MVAFASPSEGKLSVKDFDLNGLAQYIAKGLPSYARPLFIRILQDGMDITGTFKHKKSDLVKQGFNPSEVKDPMFFYNGSKFEPLTKTTYNKIISGQLKL